MNKMDKRILIVAEELQKALQESQVVVIDCRFELGDPDAGRRAYERSHIPGAVYLDLDRDLAGPVTAATGRHPLPNPTELSRTLGRLGVSRAHDVVVYDDSHGGIAARAWWAIRWLGHERVGLLDGGFARWKTLELPLESAVVQREPVDFEPGLRDGLVVTTDELQAAGENVAAFNLLDARAAERFSGKAEPIDAVAGHIPGARCVPFSDFVREDGTWLPLEQRAARILRALDGKGDVPWCVMCGSGVTACHLAISALEAGLTEPRVYIGSWSEWIRDPARPVATDFE